MTSLFTKIVPRTPTAIGIWIVILCSVFAVAAMMTNNIARLSEEQSATRRRRGWNKRPAK